jgi:hypothetical protein
MTKLANTSWLFVTFGEGRMKVLVFQAFKGPSHFGVVTPVNSFQPTH